MDSCDPKSLNFTFLCFGIHSFFHSSLHFICAIFPVPKFWIPLFQTGLAWRTCKQTQIHILLRRGYKLLLAIQSGINAGIIGISLWFRIEVLMGDPEYKIILSTIYHFLHKFVISYRGANGWPLGAPPILFSSKFVLPFQMEFYFGKLV